MEIKKNKWEPCLQMNLCKGIKTWRRNTDQKQIEKNLYNVLFQSIFSKNEVLIIKEMFELNYYVHVLLKIISCEHLISIILSLLKFIV